MKLLLTGFDPFGGEPINPAWEAVKRVSDQVGDVEVVKLMVPTVFYKSIDTVAAAIEKEKPDAVLCIGQAGGRFDLNPERVVINVNDRTSNSIMLVVWMDHQILNIANDSPVTDESSHSYNLCINVCTDNIQTVI